MMDMILVRLFIATALYGGMMALIGSTPLDNLVCRGIMFLGSMIVCAVIEIK